MLNKWSATLVERTKSCLHNIDSFNPVDGCLYLKRVDGKYGKITVANLIKGHLEIEVETSKKKIYFASTDELIGAGWAID